MSNIRYSESFKLQVVRELESGRFGSSEEASRFYGINGSMTIAHWVDKFGKAEFQRKVVRMETSDERREIDAQRAARWQRQRVEPDLAHLP